MQSSSINTYIYLYTPYETIKNALEHRKTVCSKLAESSWLLGRSLIISLFTLSDHILSNMYSQCRIREKLNVQKMMLAAVNVLLQLLWRSVFFFSRCREKPESIINCVCYKGSGNKTIYNIIPGSSLQLSCFEWAIWRVKEMLPPPFQEKRNLQLFVPKDGSCPSQKPQAS